jgi:TP901 family phage tail tape measure protein
MKPVEFSISLKDKISSVLTKISGELKGCANNVKAVGEEFNILSRIQLKTQLDVFREYGGAFANAARQGAAFGQSVADLSSITGIVGKDLEDLAANSRKLGQESGMGADSAARAYSLLASQIEISRIGIDGLNRLEKNSVTLAQAAGMSIDDAANALAGTINQFGLRAEDAERVINALAAGSKYGAAEINDLAQSFKVVGAAANAMGLNVEETAGALEVLSQANLKGSESGTALRNIILKMNTALGVDLKKTSLEAALDALKPKLNDTNFLTKVFGMENIAAAQFLIMNASAVGEMTEKVTGTNTAQEQAAIRTETTANKMAVLQAAIDDVKISITDAAGSFAPYIALAAEQADTIALLGSAASGASKMIMKMVTSTAAHKVAMVAARAATAAWTTVQAMLNAVMSANPMGILIVAIGAVVYTVINAYKNFEGFRKVCDKVWEAVKKIGSAVWDSLVSAFEKVASVVKTAYDWLVKFLGLGSKPDTSGIDGETEALAENTEAVKANVSEKKKANTTTVDFSKVKIKDDDDKYDGKRLISKAASYKEIGNNITYYQNALEKLKPTQTELMRKYSDEITLLKKKQEAIGDSITALTQPKELRTLNDINAAIEYQNDLRGKVSTEQIAGIDKEIKRLESLAQAVEDSVRTDMPTEQIKTYDELEEQLDYYESKLKRTTGAERDEIAKRITEIKKLKDAWDDAIAAIDVPADISELDTMDKLGDAISYYQDKMNKASGDEITRIRSVMVALEDKKNALQGLADLADVESQNDKLSKMSGMKLRIELEAIGMDKLKSQIRTLRNMLDDTENPLSDDQKGEIQKQISNLKAYGNQLNKNSKSGEKAIGVMGGLSDMMGSLSGVVGEGAAGWLSYGANILTAVAQALPALAQVIGGNIAQAFSGAAAQSQTVPFPLNIVALASSMAAVGAAVASIPKFANGGIAYGPTFGLFGEYAGASTNPEVVAPLDKLRSLIEPQNEGLGGTVRFRIEGRTLVGLLEKEYNQINRTK